MHDNTEITHSTTTHQQQQCSPTEEGDDGGWDGGSCIIIYYTQASYTYAFFLSPVLLQMTTSRN